MIAVLGANGFVGSYLVKRLVSQGLEAIFFVRSFRSLAKIHEIGSEVICVNSYRDDSFVATLQRHQVDTVINCYCEHSASTPVASEQGKNLGETLSSAGVSRVVHLSSSGAYEPYERCAEIIPGRDYNQYATQYGQSKAAFEVALKGSFSGSLLILTPEIIFGPGGPVWTDGLRLAVGTGPIILNNINGGKVRAIHVEDLAHLLILAANAPSSLPDNIFASYSDLSVHQFFSQFGVDIEEKNNNQRHKESGLERFLFRLAEPKTYLAGTRLFRMAKFLLRLHPTFESRAKFALAKREILNTGGGYDAALARPNQFRVQVDYENNAVGTLIASDSEYPLGPERSIEQMRRYHDWARNPWAKVSH